jgi:alpha-mannosidase
VHSQPVKLNYDLAVASDRGSHSTQGFDGKGDSLPAEMLPSELTFGDVKFELASAKSGIANAVVPKGQTVTLPEGQFNRAYILAASADGDQNATFQVGEKKTALTIEDWSGFIGQWDDRQWSKSGADDDYGEMAGLKPGYIKRADLAWYCSHHHNAAGQNVAYGYSYIFVYPIELPVGTKSIELPDNDKVRVLAISVAQTQATIAPAQPLYDLLPPASEPLSNSAKGRAE